jgi:hypothetical protein
MAQPNDAQWLRFMSPGCQTVNLSERQRKVLTLPTLPDEVVMKMNGLQAATKLGILLI